MGYCFHSRIRLPYYRTVAESECLFENPLDCLKEDRQNVIRNWQDGNLSDELNLPIMKVYPKFSLSIVDCNLLAVKRK